MSVAAIVLSVAAMGFTVFKTSPNNMYNSIMKNLEKKQQKEMEKMQEKAGDYIKANYDAIIADQPFIGNENGSKIIIKFSDYNCGHCKHSGQMLQSYVAKHSDVKVVIRELPILGKGSFDAALIAYYINTKDKSKFSKFHETLMNSENKKSAMDVAISMGFTKAEVEAAMKSDKYKDKIANTYKVAQELGIQGTPAFIIGKKFYPSAVDEAALDKELNK